MQQLLGGRPDRAGHVRLLQQLLPVYSTLESLVTERAGHPWLAAVWTPELARSDALKADLGPQALAPRLPATERYVTRLQGLGGTSTSSTARLLAHVYVRHLGDLSGGQILQRLLGTPGVASGMAFYRFGEPADVARLKLHMRSGLSMLPAEGDAADAAIDEAIWAFEHHLRLFDEVVAAGGIS